MRFIVHDTSGNILRTGQCPRSELALQAGLGEFAMEGVANDALQRIESGKVVDRAPDPPREIGYAEQRFRAYPDVRDQLDAIWKALANLPSDSLPAETQAMLNDIVAVKQRFRKPVD